MRVSILICTKDRVSSLADTLKSLSRVRIPEGWFVELVVVDNGSTDGTRALVESTSFAGRRARFAVESAPGVASARNLAVEIAEGDVLLWTDDDVRVPTDWIAGMVRPIIDGTMDAVAGGVVLANGRERYWMGACLRAWLASSEGLSVHRPGRMIGANMAFHRRVLGDTLRFDPALGPGALGMGEETLFSYQVEASGFRIGSAFRVRVEHAFDPRRLCAKGMATLARSMGRSEAYIAHHWHGVEPTDSVCPILDARLRWLYWRLRARMQSRVPPGLVEGELQAQARLYYWQYLRALSGSPRLYHRGVGCAKRVNGVTAGVA